MRAAWGERPSREVARRRCRRSRCGLHSGKWPLGDRGGTRSVGSWKPGSPGRLSGPSGLLSLRRAFPEGRRGDSQLAGGSRTEVPKGRRPPATGGSSRALRLLAARRPSPLPPPCVLLAPGVRIVLVSLARPRASCPTPTTPGLVTPSLLGFPGPEGCPAVC